MWKPKLRKQMKEVSKEFPHQGGYDAPVNTREEDDLDRWRYASEIAALIKSTPHDWSIRIGIFGKWGEGKTTVLRFIQSILEDGGDVVVHLEPWSVSTLDELWSRFAQTLLDACKKFDGGEQVPAKLWAKVKTQWIKEHSDSIDGLLESVPYAGKAASAGIGLLRGFLKIGVNELLQIRDKLSSHRIVVVIDDLDRADPGIIPRLLLSLREVLDLQGFAFILAFDNEIVSKALNEYHRAWGEGNDFLEKILDFRFVLPSMTPQDRRRILDRDISQFAPFVEKSALEELDDLLPNNPRRLRSLVRTLASLSSEVQRHNSEELIWTDIILAHLLNLECSGFADRFVQSPILEEQIGAGYLVNSALVGRNGEDEASAKADQQLEQLFVKTNVDIHTKDRLIKLVQAIRARSKSFVAEQFRYQAQLISRPHRITWKEFGEAFVLWTNTKDLNAIHEWVKKQAASRSALFEEVANELFNSAIEFRSSKLREASESTSRDGHEKAMDEAQCCLELIKAFLMEGLPGQPKSMFRTPENFLRLVKMIMQWLSFRTNPADQRAREFETNLIVEFAESENDRPELYLESLKPWNWGWKMSFLDGESTELKESLLKRLVASLMPKVVDLFLVLLQTENGVQRLFEKDRLQAIKYAIFSESSPLWTTPEKTTKLFALFDSVENDRFIHQNSWKLFHFVIDSGLRGNEVIGHEEAAKVVQNREFSSRLWKCLTTKVIQYRVQKSLLDGRQILINQGIPAEMLPIPEWLQPRVVELAAERDRSQQPPQEGS